MADFCLQTFSMYDFDYPVDRRGTFSMKWDRYADNDVIPMWVGDMDFVAPPQVLRAIEARLEHGVLGYTNMPDSLRQSIVRWHSSRHGWQIEPHWLVPLPGLVPALSVACLACTEYQGSVAVPEIVYPPLFSSVRETGRRGLSVPMRQQDGRPRMSGKDLHRVIQADTGVLLLCNPHNPGGTVYSRTELAELAQVCVERDLWICSDDIHCDLVYDGKYTPIASLSDEVAARTITLISPSKCFNLAGMCCGFAVIADDSMRERFCQASMGALGDVSVLSYIAAEAAYSEGEPWLQELLTYLRANRDRVCASLGSESGVVVHPPQATFFAWLDLRALGVENVRNHFEQHGVGLSDGLEFGSAGWGRINFATRKELLQQGLERLKSGLQAARSSSGQRSQH